MSSDNNSSSFRVVLSALVVFLGFGFVTNAILCRSIGHETVQDRAAAGVFDEATISLRQQNLDEVSTAQNALVNRKGITAAEKQIAANAASMKASKTEMVVPGSPTFLKQMKAASAAAEAKKKAEAPKKAVPVPAPKPAEKKPAATPKKAAPKKVEKAPTPATVKPKAPQPPKAEKPKPGAK